MLVLSDRGSIEGNVHGYDVVVNGRVVRDIKVVGLSSSYGQRARDWQYLLPAVENCGASVNSRQADEAGNGASSCGTVPAASPLLMAVDEVLREEHWIG